MKIGLLGGSFDPVHVGHLLAAQDAFEQCRLDRLIFVPAAQAPLKPQEVQSDPGDRLAMLQAAIAGKAQWEISDWELRRGGISYTIESARHFRTVYPRDELYWILGGDQLLTLEKWKNIAELVCLLAFIYLERPGSLSRPLPAIPGLRLHRCEGHLIEISSSELRARVRQGFSLQYFCPPNVAAYIENRQLYRSTA